MRLLLLLLAPVLYSQTPGLVQVQAGALSCGAVMRSATTIQTYCYAPGTPLVLVHNSLNTLNPNLVVDYHWCSVPGGAITPCTPAAITWEFAVVANPAGISWSYTIDASTSVSGELTKVYGTAAAPVKVGTLVNGKCGMPSGFHSVGGVPQHGNGIGLPPLPGAVLVSNEVQANCILQ